MIPRRPLKLPVKQLANAIAVILATTVATAWRAYLLSLCSSLLFPLVVLSFWQWCLIAITFRLMVVPPLSSK
jgi:hypothetical protein